MGWGGDETGTSARGVRGAAAGAGWPGAVGAPTGAPVVVSPRKRGGGRVPGAADPAASAASAGAMPRCTNAAMRR